jgi:hypothetical protein
MADYNEGDEGSGDSGVMAAPGPSKDAVKKLDQIIQVFPLLTFSELSMLIPFRTFIPKPPLLSSNLECQLSPFS